MFVYKYLYFALSSKQISTISKYFSRYLYISPLQFCADLYKICMYCSTYFCTFLYQSPYISLHISVKISTHFYESPQVSVDFSLRLFQSLCKFYFYIFLYILLHTSLNFFFKSLQISPYSLYVSLQCLTNLDKSFREKSRNLNIFPYRFLYISLQNSLYIYIYIYISAPFSTNLYIFLHKSLHICLQILYKSLHISLFLYTYFSPNLHKSLNKFLQFFTIYIFLYEFLHKPL